MKLLKMKIEKCEDCPWCQSNTRDDKDCHHPVAYQKDFYFEELEVPAKIPEWCPLPDLKPEGKILDELENKPE